MLGKEGYDPVKLAEEVKKRITKNQGDVELRLYYRFRCDRWYGGIATGDVMGCNLNCVFCWSYSFRNRYDRGFYLSPREAFRRLRDLQSRRGLRRVRLSGGEPTIGRSHLLELLKLYSSYDDTVFVVETNGILIGYDESYAKELARFDNIVVRVSFKGVEESEFHRLTGAKPEAFELQFRALENLMNAGLEPGREVYPAAMIGFSRDEAIRGFLERLKKIHPSFTDVDWEYVFLYPSVKERLRSLGIKPLRAVEPSNIPEEMI